MNNCVGRETIQEVRDSSSKIVMLENLRFHVAEEGKGIVGTE
jgi:3-phosphoglycerate kinase